MCTPSKDTRRRRVYSQIKEEKEEKEKEGGKEEIVNGIYILIEWRFVNWSMLIYNIPLIFIYFSDPGGFATLKNEKCTSRL